MLLDILQKLRGKNDLFCLPECFSFLMLFSIIRVSITYPFLFSIACCPNLLVKKLLHLKKKKNVFLNLKMIVLPSFFKDVLAGYRILGLNYFFLAL